MKAAYEVINALADHGRTSVTLPCVEDISTVIGELGAVGVTAVVHILKPSSVSALRERMNLTVEGFAARYGLDAGLVKRWERGDIEPDMVATTLLRTIAHHPEAVEASLDMEDDPHESAST